MARDAMAGVVAVVTHRPRTVPYPARGEIGQMPIQMVGSGHPGRFFPLEGFLGGSTGKVLMIRNMHPFHIITLYPLARMAPAYRGWAVERAVVQQ